MNIRNLYFFFIALFVLVSSSVANDGPRVFLLDSTKLAKMRAKMKKDPKDPLLLKIIKSANGRLKVDIPAITSKKMTPPSGDKRDYVSQAPYFWKDPSKPNGLPYINRDGERNPEILEHPDAAWLGQVVNSIRDLSTGFYFTGDERYGKKAAEILRLWFIDEKTRMNPNLNFGQGIPGRYAGRPWGIIETIKLTNLVDYIGLVDATSSLSDTDRQELKKWFSDYLKWLQTSELGMAEGNAKNNHAVYYDLQTASLSLFVGDKEKAKQILHNVKEKRISKQIEPDGKQPHEIARTRSWSYSTMNLEGFLGLAKLGESVGVDLWNYETKDGRSVRKAIDFLYPFAIEPTMWKTKQIVPFEEDRLFSLIRRTETKYSDPQFKKMVDSMPDIPANDIDRLSAY